MDRLKLDATPELTDSEVSSSEDENDLEVPKEKQKPVMTVEKQIVMKIIIRIVSNLLITKFPMDECCNNKNNLIINNLIEFLEKVIGRSRISLNQFLISNLYMFRFLKVYGDKPGFKNNRGYLCLRRLIITSLMVSCKFYGDNVKSSGRSVRDNVLRQNLNPQVWSAVSGLKTPELSKLEMRFNQFIDYNLKIESFEFNKFKSDLNYLIRVVIKSDVF